MKYLVRKDEDRLYTLEVTAGTTHTLEVFTPSGALVDYVAAPTFHAALVTLCGRGYRVIAPLLTNSVLQGKAFKVAA